MSRTILWAHGLSKFSGFHLRRRGPGTSGTLFCRPGSRLEVYLWTDSDNSPTLIGFIKHSVCGIKLRVPPEKIICRNRVNLQKQKQNIWEINPQNQTRRSPHRNSRKPAAPIRRKNRLLSPNKPLARKSNRREAYLLAETLFFCYLPCADLDFQIRTSFKQGASCLFGRPLSAHSLISRRPFNSLQV